MTRDELAQALERNKVPARYYSFDGAGGGDVWALELLDGVWTVSYYSQRGEQEQQATFASEEDGCRALFAKLQTTMREEEGRSISLAP